MTGLLKHTTYDRVKHMSEHSVIKAMINSAFQLLIFAMLLAVSPLQAKETPVLVVLGDSLTAEASATNKNIPILMVHGSQDPIIPLALAEQSRETLKQHGYGVRWHDYPMPHSVCMEEVEVIAEWRAEGSLRGLELR